MLLDFFSRKLSCRFTKKVDNSKDPCNRIKCTIFSDFFWKLFTQLFWNIREKNFRCTLQYSYASHNPEVIEEKKWFLVNNLIGFHWIQDNFESNGIQPDKQYCLDLIGYKNYYIKNIYNFFWKLLLNLDPIRSRSSCSSDLIPSNLKLFWIRWDPMGRCVSIKNFRPFVFWPIYFYSLSENPEKALFGSHRI